MECKVSELVKRGHDQAAELKASCGAVDVRDVAQLISDLATQLDVQLARINALAAENAGLKEWSPNPHSASMFEAIEKAEALMDDGMPELAMIEAFEILKMKRTPATDAYLDEVRAQGVEMFADHLSGMNIIASETSVREFAGQLRKGVQS
ncbi:hypothetical protein RUW12_002992 [Enterobacter roggenkampii]|nr:hypothetical protein [Enterobacter roggenkampii]